MNSNQFEFVGLVAGTWSLRLDFAAKMASSHDATSPCDLLRGLIAGTSPIVCSQSLNQNQDILVLVFEFVQGVGRSVATERKSPG